MRLGRCSAAAQEELVVARPSLRLSLLRQPVGLLGRLRLVQVERLVLVEQARLRELQERIRPTSASSLVTVVEAEAARLPLIPLEPSVVTVASPAAAAVAAAVAPTPAWVAMVVAAATGTR